MKSLKINFKNQQGDSLTARMELPLDQHPHNFAIFAHCFTCNKNLQAVRNISRSLTQVGIAVLRFDFTGLGESDGDFADTNFSSNIQDLIEAASFLKKNYRAPTMLIGHSLGGAAVLAVASKIETIKAVITIGAPYDPSHVVHLLSNGMDELNEKGVAKVSIGGRPFTIKKQFVEDLEEAEVHHHIQNLNRALLVMHSPQDTIVGIENATKIYKAAQHPRSFISLDGTDHLLSKTADSVYVGEVIGTWAKRYLEMPEPELLKSDKQVVVRTGDEGFTTEVKAGNHQFLADEPTDVGGNDFGPTPYDFLATALGTCTSMTLRMYADHKKWDLQEVTVHLQHDKIHINDEDMEGNGGKIDYIDRVIELEGNLDETQRKRLLEIADRCPVHKTLNSPVKINTRLAE